MELAVINRRVWCCKTVFLLFVFNITTITIYCYPTYKLAIPNGSRVPNPCDPGSTWEAVGHKNPFVAAPHNPFGKDFLRNGMIWDRHLCMLDSDGDGRTNGEELGDPLCEWSRANALPLLSVKGHPGICEPIDSSFCQNKPNQYSCPGLPDTSCPVYLRNGTKFIDNTKEMTLNMTSTHVPMTETSYVCLEVKLPADKDYHLIAAKPIVDREMVVDQIQLFACDSGLHSRVYNHPFECGEKPRGDCQNLIGGFSPYEKGVCFPPNTGYKIGQSGCKQIIFQIRYKNPYLNPALYDSSGAILYYTSNLRPYDIGTKLISVTHFTLPRSSGTKVVSAGYPEDCSAAQIKQPIFITSAFVHMHSYGRTQTVTLMRNGQPVTSIIDERSFKPNILKGYHFVDPIKVHPGDTILISCGYNMAAAKTEITWGLLSTNEMCSASLMYYPRESWLHATATSFKSIPLCKLQTTGEYKGCHYGQLFDAVRQNDVTTSALAQCATDRVCSDECSSITAIAFSHPCLRGESYDLLRSRLTKKFPALKNLMETLEICRAKPATNFNATSSLPTVVSQNENSLQQITTNDLNYNQVRNFRKQLVRSEVPKGPYTSTTHTQNVRRQPTFISGSMSSPHNQRISGHSNPNQNFKGDNSKTNTFFLPQGNPSFGDLSARPEIIAQLSAFIKSVQNPNYNDFRQIRG